MTPATQAPTAATEKGHLDPAAAVTFVPVQTRSERPASFDPADFGAPTGREVNWKHTPIDRVASVLRDEDGDPEAFVVTVNANGAMLAEGLAETAAPRGTVLVPEDLPSAIASRRSARADHVRIPADAELTAPVLIDIAGAGAAQRGVQHLVIEAEPNSRATVLLRHRGSVALAQNVEIVVRDGAALTVISVQQWDDDAVHASSHAARVDRNAALTHIVVSFGGGVVRVNPSVVLAGPGAHGKLYGLSFADSGQHLESQVYLHHQGPHTVGDVLYKGALQGESARTVWIGDVLIGPDAVGTDSYEANRNLVLTDGARADSIPNLEIETGDIAGAGHASATGRFDDEQLFYLQARGIPEEEARRMVVLGFLTEVVQKIGLPDLEDELTAAIVAELVEGTAA